MVQNGKVPAVLKLDTILAWSISGLFLVIFLISPNLNNPNGDTLGWINYIEVFASGEMDMREYGSGQVDGNPRFRVLFNPHHLLYLPVTGTIYKFAVSIFTTLEAGMFLRVWNASASAGILLVLYFTLAGFLPRCPWVALWIIFTGTSVTFFHYATDGSQYMTALFFLVLALNAVADYFRSFRSINLIQAGIALALSVLFHQIVAIILPFILMGTYFAVAERRKEGFTVSLRPLGWMAVYSIFIPVLIYLVVGFCLLQPSGEFTPSRIFKYATLYAHNPHYWNTNFLRGFETSLVTLVGFYFGVERTNFLFFSVAWFIAFKMFQPATWILGIRAALFSSGPLRRWLVFSLMWFIPLFVFLCFWNPGHEFYHLFFVPALITFAVAGSSETLGKSKIKIVATIILWLWIVLATIGNLPLSLDGSVWKNSAWFN